MRYFLAHLHSESDNDPREEAYLFVPGLVEKTVFPVPIDGLGEWLETFDAVLDEVGEQRCPCCGEAPVDETIAGRFSGRG